MLFFFPPSSVYKVTFQCINVQQEPTRTNLLREYDDAVVSDRKQGEDGEQSSRGVCGPVGQTDMEQTYLDIFGGVIF